MLIKECSTCAFYRQQRCGWLMDFPKPFWVTDLVSHAPLLQPDDGLSCDRWQPKGE